MTPIYNSDDFNPRSREGSDTNKRIDYFKLLNFNPRSREGSDEFDEYTGKEDKISIHAPAKGATILVKL